MKKLKTLSVAAVASVMILASCSDDLDHVQPRHAINKDSITENDISKLLTGVYASMEEYTFRLWFNDDIQGENFATGTGITPMLDPCNMSPQDVNSNVKVLSYWRNSFSALNQVNYVLELYYKSGSKDNSRMKEVASACHYFRAFIYYRLAAHFGNVPILRECTEDIVPISKEADVWKFVEENLTDALAVSETSSSKWYVSSDAINALAARVALFQGKNVEAAAYARKVLDNTGYKLTATEMEFSSIFLPNSSSKEIVFAFVNNTRTSGYCNFASIVNDVDGNWDYSPSPYCYENLYADDAGVKRKSDIRHFATFQRNILNNNRIIKFSNGKQQLAKNDDYLHTPVIVTRISEMYLIEAEALGQKDGAATLYQFLKTRYGSCLPESEIKGMTDREYQDLILDERRREFYAEGMRWQDVKRTGRYDLLSTLRGRTYLMYYPIPQPEIDIAGTDLYPQNDGYN